jgi:hypothetical protein
MSKKAKCPKCGNREEIYLQGLQMSEAPNYMACYSCQHRSPLVTRQNVELIKDFPEWFAEEG